MVSLQAVVNYEALLSLCCTCKLVSLHVWLLKLIDHAAVLGLLMHPRACVTAEKSSIPAPVHSIAISSPLHVTLVHNQQLCKTGFPVVIRTVRYRAWKPWLE